MVSALLLVLLLQTAACNAGASVLPAARWENDVRLDANFRMLWTITDGAGSSTSGSREVTVEVQVRTHGYVGLGFSRNGEMPGADVAIGWIHEGQPYFQVINNVYTIVWRIFRVGGRSVAHMPHVSNMLLCDVWCVYVTHAYTHVKVDETGCDVWPIIQGRFMRRNIDWTNYRLRPNTH